MDLSFGNTCFRKIFDTTEMILIDYDCSIKPCILKYLINEEKHDLDTFDCFHHEIGALRNKWPATTIETVILVADSCLQRRS